MKGLGSNYILNFPFDFHFITSSKTINHELYTQIGQNVTYTINHFR